jgi:chromosome segregation ATPase
VQSKAHANSMDKLKRESEQIVTQLRTSLTQTNNQLHQKDMFIKEMEQEYSQKLNSTKEKETEFGVKDSLIEELKETIKQKDHQIGQIKEENRLKDHSADKTIEDLKQREQQLIREKEEQVQEANVKLEAELKESLERIDELRKRNYKLLESINTLYNNKNPNTSDENKVIFLL